MSVPARSAVVPRRSSCPPAIVQRPPDLPLRQPAGKALHPFAPGLEFLHTARNHVGAAVPADGQSVQPRPPSKLPARRVQQLAGREIGNVAAARSGSQSAERGPRGCARGAGHGAMRKIRPRVNELPVSSRDSERHEATLDRRLIPGHIRPVPGSWEALRL